MWCLIKFCPQDKGRKLFSGKPFVDCKYVDYAADLPAEASETTAGEFRECRCICFVLKNYIRTGEQKVRTPLPRTIQKAGCYKA